MGEPSALEKRSKRTLAKIGEVNQAARLRSEDEALVAVEIPEYVGHSYP